MLAPTYQVVVWSSGAGLAVGNYRSAASRADGRRVAGEADFATVGQLRTALLAAVRSTCGHVVVDVVGLDFCGLAGLDALPAGLNAARAAGMVMRVRGMSAQLSWLHDTFPRKRPRHLLPVGVPQTGLSGWSGNKAASEGSRPVLDGVGR